MARDLRLLVSVGETAEGRAAAAVGAESRTGLDLGRGAFAVERRRRAVGIERALHRHGARVRPTPAAALRRRRQFGRVDARRIGLVGQRVHNQMVRHQPCQRRPSKKNSKLVAW